MRRLARVQRSRTWAGLSRRRLSKCPLFGRRQCPTNRGPYKAVLLGIVGREHSAAAAIAGRQGVRPLDGGLPPSSQTNTVLCCGHCWPSEVSGRWSFIAKPKLQSYSHGWATLIVPNGGGGLSGYNNARGLIKAQRAL